VGKWHLGAAPCFHPNARGFTEYFGFLGGGHVYLPYTKGDALYQEYVAHVHKNSLFGEYLRPVLRNDQPVGFNEYMTDALSKEAEAFITRHKSEPFFLYLAYNAVHSPLEAPEKYTSRFGNIANKSRRTYAGMTSAMDDGVGRVLKTLRDNGLENNTLVWFLNDNGGPSPKEGMPISNAPFRGYKHQVYEGGIHVPFVVQWRGHLPEGQVYKEPSISLDIFPTVAAATGAKVPEKVKLDGVDIVPYLLGKNKTPPHEALYWRNWSTGIWAVREGQYKLIGIHNKVELYNLDNDLSETRDLAGEMPEVVTRLQKLHEQWNARLIEPLWSMPKQTDVLYLGSIPFFDMEAGE